MCLSHDPRRPACCSTTSLSRDDLPNSARAPAAFVTYVVDQRMDSWNETLRLRARAGRGGRSVRASRAHRYRSAARQPKDRQNEQANERPVRWCPSVGRSVGAAGRRSHDPHARPRAAHAAGCSCREWSSLALESVRSVCVFRLSSCVAEWNLFRLSRSL